jgi:hypothetical protein
MVDKAVSVVNAAKTGKIAIARVFFRWALCVRTEEIGERRCDEFAPLPVVSPNVAKARLHVAILRLRCG